MDQPPGYETGGGKCRLLKSLYGLRQASRAWHTKLKSELRSIGFEESTADPAFFIKHGKTGSIFMVIHVDDLLCAASSVKELQEMNFHLTNGGNCFGICPCVHIRCNVDCSGRPIESFRV